ncbi:MAG: metal ABC transporter permease [Chloroflexi bacterium]|nr:metal ABC transporter permease [Chloroflexota bacterium]
MPAWLLDPLAYTFMQRGLLAAVLVGIVCALVGTFVVLRGMAFLGDALPHAILPGVAAGYLLGGGARGPVLWGSLVAAVFTALGIGALTRGARIKEDSAIGIFFAGMFALGIALISSIRSYAVDLTHFLFGNVLGVTASDLWLIGGLGALVTLTLLAFYKEFMVLSFDTRLAATLRLPTNLLENMLLVLIALTIVIALQTVGIALMVAMLVTPAATASLLTHRLHWMMTVAAGVAAFSGVAGLYLSFYASIASGAAIVLVCTACFLLAWAFQAGRARRQAAG